MINIINSYDDKITSLVQMLLSNELNQICENTYIFICKYLTFKMKYLSQEMLESVKIMMLTIKKYFERVSYDKKVNTIFQMQPMNGKVFQINSTIYR